MKIIRLVPSALLPDTCEWYLLPGYLNHPYGIGNKLWKLEGILADFAHSGKSEILSFGGAYSNHLYALAAICKEKTIPFTAIVRGEEPEKRGYTLRFLEKMGTDIQYLDRFTYRECTRNDDYTAIQSKFNNSYIIPEGGTSALLFSGFESISRLVATEFEKSPPDHMVVAAGTGGTAAGWVNVLSDKTHVHVINVLKNKGLDSKIAELLHLTKKDKHTPYTIHHEYHMGGYAAYNESLIQWINTFYEIYGIPLDPVYTGKMLIAAADLANKGKFNKSDKVLLIHTGGLQGIHGFNERWGNVLKIATIPPL